MATYTQEVINFKNDLADLKEYLIERLNQMAERPSASNLTAVAAVSNAAFTILAANNRLGYIIFNSSGVRLYVKLGTAASSSDYSYYIEDGQMYESPASPTYGGIITGRLASSSGTIRVTEHVQ